ncbi:MAG: nuclear transport factor 2 family protein [Acidobacteriota bacterium]
MDLKWVVVAVGIPLAALAQSAPPAPSLPPASSLEAAERAFAMSAAEKGIREAFLGVLAEEAVVFRPGPVAARRWYEERPPQPGLLAWAPQRVEVSFAGDLGYTFGPWVYRKDPKSPAPDACGRYLSIWKREGGGPWRLLLDTGVGHPCSDPPPEGAAELLSHQSVAEAGADRKALDADHAFTAALKGNDVAAAAALAAPDVAVFREGVLPASGPESLGEALRPITGQASWTASLVWPSSSKDLALVAGIATVPPSPGQDEPRAMVFARLWRRDAAGVWRLAADYLAPR